MTALYLLICENDRTTTLPAGLSVEASEPDGMSSATRTAEIIMRRLQNGDRVVRVVRLDLETLATIDVSRWIAAIVRAKLSAHLPDRTDNQHAIEFVERALHVTLDGDKWIPDAVASDWLRPYGAECRQVA